MKNGVRRLAAPRQSSSAEVRAEILRDLEAYNAYVAEHGSPAAMARALYAADAPVTSAADIEDSGDGQKG
jgi:hypothetical protein